MKIKDLIAQLRECPPETTIYVYITKYSFEAGEKKLAQAIEYDRSENSFCIIAYGSGSQERRHED